MKRLNSKGFTIIELLIATVIFALVLLVVTGAIVQFGRIYYKGIVQSRTQERARAITDSVAKNLQFSKQGSLKRVGNCYQVGDRGYTNTETSLLLAEGPCGTPGGAELLGENMRVVTFEIQEPGGNGTYNVNVRIVYGENEDFEKNTPSDLTGDPRNPCKAIILGGQFCAVSELRTTVVSRLRE